MVSMNLGVPGVFDLGNNRDKASVMQQQYGIDPTMGAFDYAGRGDQSRMAGFAGQQQAMDMYRQQMLGQGGPSLAQQQMQMGLGQAQRGAMGMAAMGRGGNMAGMQSQALNAGAGMALQTNAQMGLLRAQEQQAAQAGYAGMANQMYGQGFGYDQLAAQSRANAADNQLGWYSADRGMDIQQDMNSHQKMMDRFNMGMKAGQTVAAAVGGGMGGGMMSDERSKQGIAGTMGAASQAVGAINPIAHEYIEGMGPPGQRVGVSAQDLAANPATAALVQPGPDGLLRVDGNGLAALGVAASAEQEGRLRAIEQQLDPYSRVSFDDAAAARRGGPQADNPMQKDFGARMDEALARRPPPGSAARVVSPTGMGTVPLERRFDETTMPARFATLRPVADTRTIDPFEDEDQLLSDTRAKKGMASTVGRSAGRGGSRGGMRGGGY